MIPAAYLPPAAVAFVDLFQRIVDAADDLAAQGYVYDPDDDPDGAWMIPVETAAELATLAAECRECRRGPSALAQHWLNVQQVKYILSQPDWACTCGAVYKAHGEPAHGQEFYTVIDDGAGFDWAGSFGVNSKGKVTRSDPCPACGRSFAETVSVQYRLPILSSQPRRKTPPPPPEPLFDLATLATAGQDAPRPGAEAPAQPRRQAMPLTRDPEEATLF
jgi:hypothetical protein